MAEPTRWWRDPGCELLQRKCSALNTSEYCYMLCDVGVPVKRCASDRYSRGWYLGSIHEMSAKHSMGRCPITDPALDVKDVEAVIWRGEYLSAMPGDEPSSWCLDTLPNNTTDARNPEETHLSAAAHAALRCLGMQVHLEVAEKGNIRRAPCTDGATIAWAARPYDEGPLFAVTTRRCARYPPPAVAYFQWFRGTVRREHVEQDGFTGIY
ncbi:surface protease GP63 [Trypanosoma cruzi]|nr:surface protease GP63 [Trypanosoma cruzi]